MGSALESRPSFLIIGQWGGRRPGVEHGDLIAAALGAVFATALAYKGEEVGGAGASSSSGFQPPTKRLLEGLGHSV